MKIKYIYTGISLLVLGFFNACNVLDQEPEIQISNEVAFTNEKSADAALAGLYHQLQSGFYYGRNFQNICEVSSDISQSVGTWDFYRELDTYELDASNLEVTNFYTAAFRAVNQANNIIAEVPGIEMDQAKKDNIVGQAYFVRALAFFDLNKVFGGVPGVHGDQSVVLPLTPSRAVNEDLYPTRPSLVDGYNQVEADLLSALNLLPESQSNNTSTRAKAVKGTARALLSRFYLYTRNYPEVIRLSTEVIEDGQYSLLDNYIDIYAGEFTSESIFELEFIAADQSGMRFWYFPGAQGGRGELAVHESFISEIQSDENDIRGTMFGFDPVQGVFFPTKYQKPGNIDNFHIIRIAEMYLNRAEAYAHSSGTLTLAVDDLNKIKERAGVAPYSGPVTQEALLLEIEKERKFELAFEGHSFFDLVRTGRALTVLGSVERKNSSAPVSLDQPWKQILPIPRDELLSNPNMVQNPNYGN
ncbi:MAG: RagB/SusD family nutrient uptake outer membrane protein [Mongoliibacter sp.]|uniref:RagB/SusD family nutrient uptake outer membrane protein n=1 Tax=Mongoliibacter sp. TaxID=2022438 RepID=UPI0012F41052|nr:RagB/SusD family nutrient uptake outer membrane protein [Mongoliibacter sp.]TVP44406.1 MAG: RagB/SusD family nutrient uptake outer membrane protein [Mongoliibacter sp.]